MIENKAKTVYDLTTPAAKVYQNYSDGIPYTVEEMMLGLGLTRREVEGALSYWEEKGFLATKEEIESNSVPAGKIIVRKKEAVKEARDKIIDLLNGGPELTDLFGSAEQILGRPLYQTEFDILEDFYKKGLEIDAIKYLLRLTVDKDAGFGYYKKVGYNWLEIGIKDLNSAMNHVEGGPKKSGTSAAPQRVSAERSKNRYHANNETEQKKQEELRNENLMQKIRERKAAAEKRKKTST